MLIGQILRLVSLWIQGILISKVGKSLITKENLNNLYTQAR